MDKDISVDTFRIYLENKGWIKKYCSKCNGIFYTKDINNTVCGRPKTYCSSYDFLKYPRKKCSTKIKYLLDIYNDFIKENSFSKVDAIKIKKTETSLFLGSAGQLFNEEIFEEKTLNDNVFFIAQPVIRLQFANSSDTIKKNYLSSFVNLSSQYLSLQNNINKHIELFEKWLDFFSSAGLYVGHFTLKEKISSKIWKDRKVDSISYFIIYKGLEIGVVNYSIIEQFTRNNIYQSDCTFGLERLLWAVNKTSNILYNIAPDIIILQNNMEFDNLGLQNE